MPLILNLGSRWRLVATFKATLLYPQGNSLWSSNKRLLVLRAGLNSVAQNAISGCCEESNLGNPACSLVANICGTCTPHRYF